MFKRISKLCAVAIVVGTLVAKAQTSATQPMRAVQLRPSGEYVFQVPLFIKPVAASGSDALNSAEISCALSQIDRQVGEGLTLMAENNYTATWVDSGVSGFRASAYLSSTPTVNDSSILKAVEHIANNLKDQLKSTASMAPAQRAERIKTNLAEEAALNQKLTALSILNSAQGDATAVLRERLKQLRETRQKLEMDLVNKESRRRALENAVAEQQKVSAIERDRDPVLNEMRKLVSLREDELKLKRLQINSAVISATEANAAEAQLSEAKIRLAEREAALGKGGKGELLDRLTDELVMISVDATDVQLQLGKIKSELQTYDTGEMNATNLDELMKHEASIFDGGAKTSHLATELKDRKRQLQSERFALKTTDVTVTIDASSAFDRGGGGS